MTTEEEAASITADLSEAQRLGGELRTSQAMGRALLFATKQLKVLVKERDDLRLRVRALEIERDRLLEGKQQPTRAIDV